MPRINIITPPWQAQESVDSGKFSASLIDGVLSDLGALLPRPALMKYKQVETYFSRCQGVFWWEAKELLLVVFDGRLYASACTDASLTFTHVNAAALCNNSALCTFAANRYWVYVATSGRLVRWDGDLAGAATYDTSAAAPTSSSHVAYIDGYILANEIGTQSWYYAEPTTPDTAALVWSASGLTAEGSPDNIKSLTTSWREVLIVGNDSAEVWYDSGDATTPFQRLEGAFIEQGTLSPHSIAEADNTWIWLNEKKQVIRLQGRTPAVISFPIRKELENIQYVEDAVGFMLWEYYILTFPQADVTWVYDLVQQCWYQWGAWSADQYLYSQFKGKFATWSSKFGVHFLGGDNGVVYITDRTVRTDDHALVRTEYVSRPIDHGTFQYKFCNSLIAKYKRGSSNEAETLGRFLELIDAGVQIPLLAIGEEFYFQWDRAKLLGTRDWTWAWSPLPAGMTFNAATRELTDTGIGIATGQVNSILTLTNNASGFVLQFPITLNPGADIAAPVLGPRSIELYFQDEDADWSTAIELDAGETGDTYSVQEFSPMGRYSVRRYKIVFGSTIDVAFADLSEIMEEEA